jgi:hypothetical protein
MSGAEVMATSVIAAMFFGGNKGRSRTFLKEQGYISKMLDKSRFKCRQHRIVDLFLFFKFYNLYQVGSFQISGKLFRQAYTEGYFYKTL